jgi:hypothetical protein
MKKSIWMWGVIAAITTAGGCGGCGKKPETETIDANSPLSIVSNLGKVGERLEQTQKEAEARMVERQKRGDTVAIDYKVLQGYLPTRISGYEKDGDAKGESSSMSGFSLSTCSQRFKKGDDHVEVTITDYVQGYEAFQGIFSVAGMFSLENDEQKATTFDAGVAHTTGMENYQKKTKEATVTLGTGYRFWIQVQGNNQPNTDLMKEVAKSMNLKELSEK